MTRWHVSSLVHQGTSCQGCSEAVETPRFSTFSIQPRMAMSALGRLCARTSAVAPVAAASSKTASAAPVASDE